MSNAPDDPGHRPTPPRQGDPQPYPGPPQPPYGAYAPPPNQPPPPAGPWQGPPPGFDPNSPPPPGTSGYQPRPAGRGFTGALFDLNFDHMVTPRLIKGAYGLAIAVYSLIALLMLLFAWSFFVWNKPLGFISLIATPIVWTGGLLTTRMFLEFLINQFKITEHLKVIREQGESR
jgi:hypothetical protein